MDVLIGTLPGASIDDTPVEIVERKGLGHPDTICDNVAEALSIRLCRAYLERFGAILHHNVDKALLVGGAAAPRFGGGRVLAPMELFLAGRAIRGARGEDIPLERLAVDSCLAWLREHMHALDADGDVRVHCLVRPGSDDLIELYDRQRRTGEWLANDTSFGVGHAPLSRLEQVVLAVERRLNASEVKRLAPEIGEDIKVMGVRRGDRISLTVACAMVDRYLADISAYLAAKRRVEALAREAAAPRARGVVDVHVNTADDIDHGSVFMTVTGTSAEAGDDGQVGRGNRVNGLITPCRPMTLEAAAGKNPVTHVGKLYSVTANLLAADIAAGVPGVTDVVCRLVSEIGRPICKPAAVDIQVRWRDERVPRGVSDAIRAIVQRHLAAIPSLASRIVEGGLSVCP